MRKDALRLTRFAASAALLPIGPGPVIMGAVGPQPVPLGLSAEGAATIYGKVARYGFSGFQMLPGGGAQLASADQVTFVTLAGVGWQYVEDLNRSAFQLAVEKQSVVLQEFFRALGRPTMFMSHVVDIQALWPLEQGGQATEFIEKHFLKTAFRAFVADLGDLQLLGGGTRWAMFNLSPDPVPAGVDIRPIPPINTFDLRVEPYLQDVSQLFLQATAIYPVPTADLTQIATRAEFVRNLLYEHMAARIMKLANKT